MIWAKKIAVAIDELGNRQFTYHMDQTPARDQSLAEIPAWTKPVYHDEASLVEKLMPSLTRQEELQLWSYYFPASKYINEIGKTLQRELSGVITDHGTTVNALSSSIVKQQAACKP